MTAANARDGFTILELVLTMVATSVLALTLGVMLYFSYRAWGRSRTQVELQRDMTHTMDMLSRQVRPVSTDNIDTNIAERITITPDAGAQRRFARLGRNLVFDPDTGQAGNEVVLISNRVDSFSVALDASSLTVSLALSEDEEQVAAESMIRVRN